MRKLCVMGMVVALMAMTSGSALASGFALIEQSVKGLGTAFSGGAAVADDPSTVYFNPAGMTRLEGQQAQAAVHVVIPQSEFKGTATTGNFGAGNIPITGGDGGQGGVIGTPVNLYYTLNLGNDWTFGLGINNPFGLATEWEDGWVGRYHALKSNLKTWNLNPSVAYKINDKFSVGAGVSAQYVDAELSNAIDFGTITFLQTSGGTGTPTQQDGKVVLNADDWGYGYNFGVLLTPTESTRIGAAYRSRIVYSATGDADFTVPATVPGPIAAVFADTGVKADITLPDSASLSVVQTVTDRWNLMADITWTNWSVFDELRVEFDSGLSDNVTVEAWEDSWRYSLGTTFDLNEHLTLRGGLAYDETPIPDERRTPRIPGDDRFWVALGCGYAVGNWSFDAGYAHLFVDNAKVDLSAGTNFSASEFTRGDLNGEFDNSVDIISVEASLKF